MKTRLIFLVLLFINFSCGTTNKPVSNAEKDKIKGQVKEVVDAVLKGMEEANFEMFIEPWLDSPDLVFITDGMALSYKGIVDEIKPRWSALLNQKITIVNEKFAFLDNSTVLYTFNGKCLINYKDGHSVLADPVVMLLTFKKINSRWRVLYAANSFVRQSVINSGSSTELNQAELLKKFVGNWEIPFGKDSTQFLTIKSLQGEKGLSVYSKWTSKGKLLFEGTGFWVYDAEINKIDNSFLHSSGYVFHDIGEFISPNTFEFTDVNKMTKAVTKFKLEIISPNEIKGTTLIDNKAETVIWKRLIN